MFGGGMVLDIEYGYGTIKQDNTITHKSIYGLILNPNIDFWVGTNYMWYDYDIDYQKRN